MYTTVDRESDRIWANLKKKVSMPIAATQEKQSELTIKMGGKFEKEPTGNGLLRVFTASRNANHINIDWSKFRKSALNFVAAAALTMIGIGFGAWVLLFVNTRSEGVLSAMACQALSGIASFPLMAVSSLVLIQGGLVATLLLIWLPRIGKWGKLGEVIKASYKGIADFSIQLPLAIGGVATATAVHSTGILTLLWLFPLALCLSSLQKLVFSIIMYSDSDQSIGWKWAAFAVTLTAIAGFTYAAMNFNWQPFLNTPPLCY